MGKRPGPLRHRPKPRCGHSRRSRRHSWRTHIPASGGGRPLEHLQQWRYAPRHACPTGLPLAQSCPRCGARTKSGRGRSSPCDAQRPLQGMHGGTSTGQRTEEGIARCTAARTKHGRRNAAARARATERRKARPAVAELRRLLAMIQKGDDSGIDPVLDLLNRANVSQ
jgi:hypothetical protein